MRIAVLLSLFLLSAPNIYAKPVTRTTLDPFVKTWLYNNGASTYSLKVTPSDAPGSSYSVSYQSPDDNYASDFCSAVNSNTITCPENVSLVLNQDQHFITLNPYSSNLKYYDPDFMPPMAPIYGTWKYTYIDPYDQSTNTATVIVKLGDNADEVKIDTAFTSSNGNYCQWPGDDVYRLTTNKDGSQRYVYAYNSAFGFLYNPNSNTITKLPEQDNLTISDCIGFGEEVSAKAVFKK